MVEDLVPFRGGCKKTERRIDGGGLGGRGILFVKGISLCSSL